MPVKEGYFLHYFDGEPGFSLLEILVTLGILSIILVYLINLGEFTKHRSKIVETRQRMERAISRIKSYYRSQQNLPIPASNPPHTLPVQAGQLDLPQKFRLDLHGHFFEYFRATKTDRYTEKEITDLVGLLVDGTPAAGVLISLGPNQSKDYNSTDSIDNPKEFKTSGDDILLPISVSQEALEIVLNELETLQKRVNVYGRLFTGIGNDNNANDSIYNPDLEPFLPNPPFSPYDASFTKDHRSYWLIDEDGCIAANRFANNKQCIFDPQAIALVNDPNCGRATLDACQKSNALFDLLSFYQIEKTSYYTDPWGNFYKWGNSMNLSEDDRRYHQFFSMGPDGDAPTKDDITPY